jgi:hypothetical protein
LLTKDKREKKKKNEPLKKYLRREIGDDLIIYKFEGKDLEHFPFEIS